MWAEGEPNGDFRVLSALLAFPPWTMFLVGHNFSAPVVSCNGRTSAYWLTLRIVDWGVAERLGTTCTQGVGDDISGCYFYRGVSISLHLFLLQVIPACR